MNIAQICRPLKRSKFIQPSQVKDKNAKDQQQQSNTAHTNEYSSAKSSESIYFQVLRLSHKFIIHIHDETHALAIMLRFNHSTINLL